MLNQIMVKFSACSWNMHVNIFSSLFNNVPVYIRPIYEGILDYDAYINALYDAGCEYALVEQDFTYDEDPFDCLKRSYDNVINKFPEMK